MTPEFALGYRAMMLDGIQREAECTKKVIAAVPDAKSDYRPDPHARTAKELAWHLANTDIQFLDGIADLNFNMVCCIIGSLMPQNLCIGVTPIRKITISQAPSFARYPSRIERPPAKAITPDRGTRSDASGTPCEAAKPMVWLEKCVKPDIKKISANRTRPSTTTAVAIEAEGLESVRG
jgi:hypothetical protein